MNQHVTKLTVELGGPTHATRSHGNSTQTTVKAPVVGDVEGVEISMWMFSSGVISIWVVPDTKPPAAKIILLLLPVSPVARTRFPSPVGWTTDPPDATLVTFAAVFAYVKVVAVGVAVG